MASGDTKTNEYLDIAAHGTREDLPSCSCETRTQSLIRDVAERIMDVEDEVQEMQTNPDVVDIVASYADLQNYDTSTLTDKDVIRVLSDSTHDGASAYYRYNASTGQFSFIGATGPYLGVDNLGIGLTYDSGNQVVDVDMLGIRGDSDEQVMTQEATTAMIFRNAGDTSRGAIWIANDGGEAWDSESYWASDSGGVYIGHLQSAIGEGESNIVIGSYNATSDYSGYNIVLGTENSVGTAEDPATGNVVIGSSSSVLSNGPTGSVALGTGHTTVGGVAIGDTCSTSGGDCIAIGWHANATSRQQEGIAIGAQATATGNRAVAIGGGATNDTGSSVALGYGSVCSSWGEVNIGDSTGKGYGYVQGGAETKYQRLLTGVADGVSAHDAATYGQLSRTIINGGTTAPTTSTVGAVGTLYSYVEVVEESGATITIPHTMVCTEVIDESGTTTYIWTDLLEDVYTQIGDIETILYTINNGLTQANANLNAILSTQGAN